VGEGAKLHACSLFSSCPPSVLTAACTTTSSPSLAPLCCLLLPCCPYIPPPPSSFLHTPLLYSAFLGQVLCVWISQALPLYLSEHSTGERRRISNIEGFDHALIPFTFSTRCTSHIGGGEGEYTAAQRLMSVRSCTALICLTVHAVSVQPAHAYSPLTPFRPPHSPLSCCLYICITDTLALYAMYLC